QSVMTKLSARFIEHESIDIEGYTQYKGWWADTGLPIAPEQWGAARAILKGETSIGECVEIETFGGKRRVILNSAIPLRGDDGEAKGCFVVNQDITALHRSEQRLLGTERTLRALSQRLVETQSRNATGLRKNCMTTSAKASQPCAYSWPALASTARNPGSRRLLRLHCAHPTS
ncbi:PAS domain-containing protein, partial [Roseateles sp. GG27B]